MAFDLDIEYVKGNSIPHVDALSRLRFYKESKDKTEEEFEDTFLHWIETDVLSLDRMAAETRRDPVLNRITFRNGPPKTLVSNNAPEFYDEDLNLWLDKIWFKSHHPRLNGLTERMVQAVKMGLKACSLQKDKIEVFLPKLLLSYRKTRKPISFNGKTN